MESTQFVDNIFHIFYRIISSLLCISHLSRFSRLGIGGVILSSLTIATSYQLISSSTIHMLHNLLVDNIFHYVPYPSSTYSALFIEVLRIGNWRGDPQFVDNICSTTYHSTTIISNLLTRHFSSRFSGLGIGGVILNSLTIPTHSNSLTSSPLLMAALI